MSCAPSTPQSCIRTEPLSMHAIPQAQSGSPEQTPQPLVGVSARTMRTRCVELQPVGRYLCSYLLGSYPAMKWDPVGSYRAFQATPRAAASPAQHPVRLELPRAPRTLSALDDRASCCHPCRTPC